MKLYFLRHGKADWPEWDRPDDERPLTKKGKKEMRRVAKLLRELAVEPGVILTSPLPRARETAEIVATRLGLSLKVEVALAPGFRTNKLRPFLTRNRNQDLMLVGHEPDFSLTIAALTGVRIKLAKGGIARLDCNETGADARIVWLIPPATALSR